MKKLLLIALFSTLIIGAKAQKIKWYSFEEGIEEAAKSHKKVFIDVYTEWCGYCVKMDKTTFANSEVAQYMNDNFVAIKLDAETNDTINFKGYQFVNPQQNSKRSNNTLAYALIGKRLSFPSFVFMTENDFDRIDVLKGYVPKDRFLSILKFIATDSFKSVTFKDYMEKQEKSAQ